MVNAHQLVVGDRESMDVKLQALVSPSSQDWLSMEWGSYELISMDL